MRALSFSTALSENWENDNDCVLALNSCLIPELTSPFIVQVAPVQMCLVTGVGMQFSINV